MSREFNRYIEKQFASLMRKFYLEPTRASGSIAWPGERCFRTRSEGTVCWICVHPEYRGLNKFNVELAWSHRGGYPSTFTARPTLTAAPPECFSVLEEGFIRLGSLAHSPKFDWWEPPTLREQLEMLTKENVASVADPLIHDALQSIENIGLPLAEQAIGARAAFLTNKA